MLQRTGRRLAPQKLLPAALGLATVVACTDDLGTPAPNTPPDTVISSGLPAEGESVPHHVRLDFRGEDDDGTVGTFEYFVQTYPKSIATYDEITVQAPQDSDPGWTEIRGFTVELVLAADTLRADPRGDIGEGRFDRWHTFFVRAVDNEGAKDPTPAARTFNAYTIAPVLWLLDPAVVDGVAELPSTFVMNWFGNDDIGNEDFDEPLEARWVLRPAVLDGGGRPIGFPDALYDLAESEWSEWQSWNPQSSRRAALFDVLSQFPGDSTFVFAVQGRDDAGAITPQFTDAAPNNNMAVVHVRSDLPVGPTFELRDIGPASLGSWMVEDQSEFAADATGVASVTMEWDLMQTSSYGARRGDYRYTWSIGSRPDPNDDGAWSPWSTGRQAPAHDLTSASEWFGVQARDDIGVITTGIVHFISTGR